MLRITAILATAAIALPGAAPAQTAPDSKPATAAAEQADFTNDQLHTFSVLYVDVEKLQKEYEPRLTAAAPEAKSDIEQERNEKMAVVIKAHGMDLDTFNAITKSANSDEKLRARIAKEMAKVQAKTGR